MTFFPEPEGRHLRLRSFDDVLVKGDPKSAALSLLTFDSAGFFGPTEVLGLLGPVDPLYGVGVETHSAGLGVRFKQAFRFASKYWASGFDVYALGNGRALRFFRAGWRYYDPLERLLDPGTPWLR